MCECVAGLCVLTMIGLWFVGSFYFWGEVDLLVKYDRQECKILEMDPGYKRMLETYPECPKDFDQDKWTLQEKGIENIWYVPYFRYQFLEHDVNITGIKQDICDNRDCAMDFLKDYIVGGTVDCWIKKNDNHLCAFEINDVALIFTGIYILPVYLAVSIMVIYGILVILYVCIICLFSACIELYTCCCECWYDNLCKCCTCWCDNLCTCCILSVEFLYKCCINSSGLHNSNPNPNPSPNPNPDPNIVPVSGDISYQNSSNNSQHHSIYISPSAPTLQPYRHTRPQPNDYSVSSTYIKKKKCINPDDTCSICLDINCNEILGCSHVFHLDCIEEWLNHSTDRNCPICRATILA